MYPHPLPGRTLTWRSLAGLFLAVLIGLLSPPAVGGPGRR